MTTERVLPEPVGSRVGEDVLPGEGSPACQQEGPDVSVDFSLPGLDAHTQDEGEDHDVLLSYQTISLSSNEYFTHPEQRPADLLIHCVCKLCLQIRNSLLDI